MKAFGSPRPVRPFEGWALDLAVSLDRPEVARGLVADICRSSPLKRQATFAVLAWITLNEGRLPSAWQPTCLATEIRQHTARELLTLAFGSHIPAGFLRALARAGVRPFDDPALYTRLLDIFRQDAAVKANALRYCGPRLRSAMVRAVDSLDVALVDPQIVRSIHTTQQIEAANAVVCELRRVCSKLTDGQIRTYFRARGIASAGLRDGALRCLVHADPLRPPLDAPLGADPVDTVRKLNALGREMGNCLRTKVGDVPAGQAYFYVSRVRQEESGRIIPFVIELQALSHGTWIIEDVHGPGNRPVPRRIATRLIAVMETAGAITRIKPAPQGGEQLAKLLGIDDWDMNVAFGDLEQVLELV